MTDTKTKPDGWVSWRKGTAGYALSCDERGAFIPLRRSEEAAKEEFHEVDPVCLVPPALLDWVEEVEKYLEAERHLLKQETCLSDIYLVEELLNKLKEVRK